jgi:hypothetical protein
VGWDEVEQDADPELGRGRDQCIEIFERAEVGVDVEVVRNVVTPVAVGRREGRIEPDAVDAEPVQVLQPLAQTGKVADAVTVRVCERTRIRLIQNAP